jgi:myosin heavy subunit
MLRKYINHCAVMIQANIRGALTRKKYKVAIQHHRLFIDLLNDIVKGKIMKVSKNKGWKTRRCFKHRACKRIIMEIRELEHFEKEDDEGEIAKYKELIF